MSVLDKGIQAMIESMADEVGHLLEPREPKQEGEYQGRIRPVTIDDLMDAYHVLGRAIAVVQAANEEAEPKKT